ncbi:response regulator [Castellaniella caeni]|uniref:response regulator n=1 Tax=Castellaniella caeni TaxID=266123 RepID=UPI000832F860|nr:response regulator transcription factor [Castellaniella caeni]
MTIRILLIDDHSLFRTGIRLLLQRHPDFSIVGEAADGVEGIKLARKLAPDLILLDLNMPGLSGLATLQILTQEAPDCAVLILTVSEDADDLGQALQAGANGYLLKNVDGDALVAAIHRIAAGDAIVADEMTRKLVEQFRQRGGSESAAPRGSRDRLTQREREIVQCLVRGESNKLIARSLDLSESTVKIHIQNILKKLNLNSRIQVAVYAVEHGLLDGNPRG